MVIHILFIVLLFIVYYQTGGAKSDISLKIRKRQVSWMGFLLFIFAALRSPTVGYDILGTVIEAGYYADYSQDASMSFAEIFSVRAGRDPFFHSFLKVLSFISDSPQFMLIVVGAIFVFGFSYFVYHSKGNVLLIYMMLIGFRIFSFSLSGLRQAIALGLIYVAYIFFRDKRYRLFLILTGIATLFHQSAMIFLLVFPLMFVPPKYVLGVLVFMLLVNFAGGIIITNLASLFFGGRFDSHLALSANKVFEGGATFYLYITFFVLILTFYRKMKRRDEYFDKEISIISMGIFFSVIGQTMDAVFRIAYYFIFLLFPATSLMLDCMFVEKKTSRAVSFIASLLLAVQYILLGTGAGTQNYEFFWTFNYL